MTNTYPRDRRVVTADDFSSAFRMRPAQRTAHFVLYARPGLHPHARLGIVAAKRFAPRAVTRNAIKRAVREVFRQSRLRTSDCIVRLSAPVNTKSQPAVNKGLKSSLRHELLALFSGQRLDRNA